MKPRKLRKTTRKSAKKVVKKAGKKDEEKHHEKVTIVGAGLAGCEACWQLVKKRNTSTFN